MKADLQALRQLAERSKTANTWRTNAEGLQTLDFKVAAEHSLAFERAASEDVVLELLDRLERAERKLREAHERVTDSRDYREEMLALLDPEAP